MPATKFFAVLFLRFAIFDFVQELRFRERRLARIDHDVVLVIDDALELAGAHVEHQAEPGRHALVEPDVRDRHGQLDVAHALAAHARQRHLDAATIADHALVLDPLVFSAGALPVAGRTENALAKQAALFRLEGPVVDRLRILDLALAPRPHRVRGSDADRHLIEAYGAFFTHQFPPGMFVHYMLRDLCVGKIKRRFRGMRSGAWPPTFTSRPNDCISLINTLKDSGVPASSELSPLTIDS